MEAAIVLNGNQVQKIIKNKKFYKIVRNPNIKILEECSKELLDEKYDYWYRLLNRDPEEEKIEESKFFNFKNPKTGFPKFKSKKFDKKSYTTNCVNNSIKIISQNHIQLPKLGIMRFIEHRRIPQDYIIKSATISQLASRKYYISILTEYNYEIPNKVLDKSKSIGLDYSSHDFYVDSQNRSPENFKHLYRILESKFSKEQRKLSRMKLHSANYDKQKIKVAKVHEKIQNQRKDFIEKLSYELSQNMT